MKKYITVLCFILLCVCTLTFTGCKRQTTLSQYQGKWVIINYWAKWCKPCMQELPELNSFYRAHKDKVVVLGISFDILSKEHISKFSKKLGLTFPMLQDFPIQEIGVRSVGIIPVTFVINPSGQLVDTLNGPQTRYSLELATGLRHG